MAAPGADCQPMGTVHDLLEAKGKQQALLLSGLDRREIEAAATYMADEDLEIGFSTPAGAKQLCRTGACRTSRDGKSPANA